MFPIPFNFPFRKKDGSVTTIDAAISGGGTPYTLPTASAETKGGVKIGSGLSMSGEVLNNSNPTPYTLPTASAETKGGVKVGSGLSIDENGVLSATGGGGGTSVSYVEKTVSTTSTSAYVDYDVTSDIPAGKTPFCAVYECSQNMWSPYSDPYLCVLSRTAASNVYSWTVRVLPTGANTDVRVEGKIRIYYY